MTPAVRQGEVLSYSIAGAATAIGVSPRTIQRKIEAGELDTFNIGRRTLIPAESLREMVRRYRSTPAAAKAA